MRNMNSQLMQEKWLFLLLALCLFSRQEVYSQEPKQIISGIILDNEGEPIIGASVVEVGSDNNGTATNLNGEYSLTVSKSSKIEISYIGYLKQLESVGNRKHINITLQLDQKNLDEVVVVGYGTLSKKEVTSAITSMKNEDLTQGLSSNPLMSLMGKVAGLTIESNKGSDPNAGTQIQLRGANSINGGMGPLVVVDGIPGGNINNIPREDIQSIDILKDASASAIYGTRASGGVILVTTKKGQKGKVKTNYDAEFTTEQITRVPQVLNRDQYLGRNDYAINFGGNTDWIRTITRTPFTQRHNLSMSGGGDGLNVYTSISYKSAEGVALENDRQELGGRINYSYKTLNDKLTISGHLNYTEIDMNKTDDDIFRQALTVNPTRPLYDENDITGYNVWTDGYGEYNPVAHIKASADMERDKLFMGDLTFKYKVSDNLNTSLSIAKKSNTYNYVVWRSSQDYISRKSNVRGYAKQENKNYDDVMLNYLINYDRTFNKNSLKTMVGYSFQEFNGQGFWAQNEDFPVDGIKWYDMNSGIFLSDGKANLDSWRDPRERLIATFGRANYSYNETYLGTISARYEGSSKFAPGKQWGLFPSISAGWRISNEKFMKNIKGLDNLLIRFGYGRTGNQDIPGGKTVRMYSPDQWWMFEGNWIKSYGLDHNQNTDLQWETQDEYDLGIDGSFFNNRFNVRFDIYYRDINNLIYELAVSVPPSVHDKTFMNAGSMTNKGIELTIGGTPIQLSNGFKWNTSIDLSSNINTLVSLDGSSTYRDLMGFPAPGVPGNGVRLAPGERIGQFYLYKYAAISDGTNKYVDKNGATVPAGNWMIYNKDGKVIPALEKANADKQYFGNAIPKLIMAWQNNITYRNIDLSIFFRGWFGQDVFNMPEMYGGTNSLNSYNLLISSITKNKHITAEKELTNYFLEKGSFLKLDAVTLGYNLHIASLENYIKKFRISFTGRNLLTLTNYSGVDPEVTTNGLTPGFDELQYYPKTRSYTLSLQVNF